MTDRVSRRSFLGCLGTLAASYPLLLWSPKSLAGMVPFAFFKRPAGNGSGSGYQVGFSLRFNAGNSAYWSRTPSTAGNQKQWTWSGWIKRSGLGREQEFFGCRISGITHLAYLNFTAGDQLRYYSKNASNAVIGEIVWNPVFRDPSAWFHLVVNFDATAGTIDAYVNGNLVSKTINTAIQNQDHAINATYGHTLACDPANPGLASFSVDGYLSEIHFIDGQALQAASFGQIDSTTGQWAPKPYSGPFGTNGFYLPFKDNSAVNGSGTASGTHPNVTGVSGLGADYSGNNNHWTGSGLNAYDQVLDSPTNNYATLNPLANAGQTLSGANLTAFSGGVSDIPVFGTVGIGTGGKFYFEATQTSAGGTTPNVGVSNNINTSGISYRTNCILYRTDVGNVYQDSSGVQSVAAATNDDVIGVAVDNSSGTPSVQFYKNGSTLGSAQAMAAASPIVFPVVSCWSSGKFTVNFGQGGQSGLTYDSNSGGRFKYTPPSGYKALCTANLPAPAIAKPGLHFNVLPYTGGTAQTGAGFAPDLVWIKTRNIAYSHRIQDRVRGAGATFLSSDQAGPENSNSGYVTSFDPDGFTTNGNNGVIDNSVAWLWKAGGAPVAGTGTGGITNVLVSANPTAGFSIVTYTGSSANGTVTHGLGAVPKVIFLKCRNNTRDWAVWHTDIANTEYLVLNTQAGKATDTGKWNSTSPTSSVFSLGSYSGVNYLNDTYVAYCFAEVAGFSKIGSYIGNGSGDGPFVYCGFRPRWLMVKSITSGAAGFDWYIYDSARSTYNPVWLDLRANQTAIEDSGGLGLGPVDFVSNGFKMRSSVATNYVNQGGDIYVFATFAEMPFKYATAR